MFLQKKHAKEIILDLFSPINLHKELVVFAIQNPMTTKTMKEH